MERLLAYFNCEIERLLAYFESLGAIIVITVAAWDWTTWLQVLIGLWFLADIILTLELALRRRIFASTGLCTPKVWFNLPVLLRNLLRWPWSLYEHGTNVFIWWEYDWKNGQPDSLWGI